MSLSVDETLQNAQTSGTGVAYDIVADAREIKFYVIGNGAVSAGAVTLEEAHDPSYTGTWAPLETPVDVIGDGVVTRARSGCFRAVRARITTPVTGGSVTVLLMGNKEP